MKKLKFLLATTLCSFSLFSHNIYDSIDILEFDPAGYFATEGPLDQILRHKEVKTVIELGSWAGASTRFFGYRVGKEGTVYAIDHWLGTPNHRGEMTDERLSYIYQLFLSNIQQAGLEERVIPLRMTTDEALKALRHVTADLIYVDAARDSARVYKDIMNWYPHLNEGGVICGTELREPSVREGVQKAAAELGMTIETNRKGFFWILKH